MRNKLKGLGWIGIIALLAGAAALGLPAIIAHIPWSFEARLARWVNLSSSHRVCTSQAADPLLQKLLRRIYPIEKEGDHFPVSVKVLDQDDVNAFASFNGEIFVLGGLLKEATSPEELAGVLAHEIEHVSRRHILQGAVVRLGTTALIHGLLAPGSSDPRLWQTLMHLRFSRDQEAEADRRGLERLKRARVSVAGYIRFFERTDSSSLFSDLLSDHPPHAKRIETAKTYLKEPSEPVLSTEEWRELKSICR